MAPLSSLPVSSAIPNCPSPSTAATSSEVSATPVAIVTGSVFDEDFTIAESYGSGDLAGQSEWSAVSGSSTNAFEVDPAGTGFADRLS